MLRMPLFLQLLRVALVKTTGTYTNTKKCRHKGDVTSWYAQYGGKSGISFSFFFIKKPFIKNPLK
jgi:hypothetical protein